MQLNRWWRFPSALWSAVAHVYGDTNGDGKGANLALGCRVSELKEDINNAFINWSDVWKMVESIKVPLIVIGVALALASIVSLAVEEQSDDVLPGRPLQRWLHHER